MSMVISPTLDFSPGDFILAIVALAGLTSRRRALSPAVRSVWSKRDSLPGRPQPTVCHAISARPPPFCVGPNSASTAGPREKATAAFQPALRVPADGPASGASNVRKDPTTRPARAALSAEESATLRDHLIADLDRLQSSDEAADPGSHEPCGQEHIDGRCCGQRGVEFPRESS